MGPLRATLIATGGVTAVFGLYWDDAWHTDVGRDTFFSPPHLLLYAGISVLLAVAASWAWRRYRAEGWAALRDPSLALPLLGAGLSLGSAPLDEMWHQLFGRDSVVWSPPHMVIVAGLVAFAAGLLLAVQRDPGRPPAPAAAAVIGAFLIAAAGTVVLEFEADVPQFPVVLYLPVAVVALTFVFALLHRASAGPWAATQAAAVYVALRIGVVGFLAVLGHSLPTVMPTVVAAGAFDLAVRRSRDRWRIAAFTAVATVGSHAAAHALQPAGLSFTALEVAVGAVVGVPASWLALAAVGVGRAGRVPDRRRIAQATAAGLFVLLVMGPAGPASAHDPGQGEELAPVVLSAVRDGERITLDVTGPRDCAGWQPLRVVARRAGRSPDGPLAAVGNCRFAGTVVADEPGRWFVYAEMQIDGRLTEAWLPVERGPRVKDTVLYVVSGEGPHAIQVVAGVALYGLVFAILAAVALTYRRAAPGQAVTSAAPSPTGPRKVYR